MMNRQLKFRAWTGKGMIYPSIDRHYTQGKILDCFSDELIMQYTGQQDKTGKEIYEGDVRREEVEYDTGDEREYYVCVFIKEWSRFAWLHLSGEYQEYLDNGVEHFTEDMNTFGIFEYEREQMIICGNIYENPEYLTYDPEAALLDKLSKNKRDKSQINEN